ncbi:MAG: hypothetical protein KDA48_00325, partial [Amphiplicatus sp.]|nr:hypothetical protein [Amphiplicatus sp.]
MSDSLHQKGLTDAAASSVNATKGESGNAQDARATKPATDAAIDAKSAQAELHGSSAKHQEASPAASHSPTPAAPSPQPSQAAHPVGFIRQYELVDRVKAY